jgi:hypothetical protein
MVAIAVGFLIALLCQAQEQPAGAPRQVPPAAVTIAPAQEAAQTTGALDFYAQLTGRTILQGGGFPSLPQPISAQLPSETNAAIAFIEGELSKSGMTLVKLGDKFVAVLPPGWSKETFEASLGDLKPPTTTNTAGGGTLAFPGIDLDTFLDFYSKVDQQHTLLRPYSVPSIRLQLTVQKPLSKEEIAYAMKVVLLLNGVAAIEDGEKFVQVVPVSLASQARAHAPKPERGAKLIAVNEIPVFRPGIRGGVPLFPKPITQPTVGERIGEVATNARNAMLGPPPPPPPPTVMSLAEYYARLAGKELQVTPQLGSRNIIFEVKTPLTKAEILYAIEATLALEGLAIIPVEGKTVRVGKLSELPDAAGTTTPPAK